jgi:hypothetical protein
MGLEKSTDGGLTWHYDNNFYPNPEGDNDRGSVSSIAWDPVNPNYVYAAHGWLGRGDRLDKVTGDIKQKTSGARKIAVSHDSGETWQFVPWSTVNGEKNCYAVKVNPVNGDVYLSTEAGIYESTDHGMSWTKIPSPGNTADYTKGVSVSANGKYLYATFRMFANNSDNYQLYGMRLSEKVWYNVHGTGKNGRYFDPAIDQRDSANSHHILLAGLANPSTGLWEGQVEWPDSGAPTNSWEQIFKESWNVNSNGYTYDQGWRPTTAKCSQHLYTPATWERKIWTTDDEGIFVGDPEVSKFARWQPRYCKKVGSKNGKGLYATRGFESTWTWDVDASDDFIIQGQADNGIAQSWDNGNSWQQYLPINNFSDCGATLIVKKSNPKMLIVGGSINVYGGGNSSNPGKLYARMLPNGEWSKGMDFPKIYSLTEDPFNSNRIIMGTARGLYTLEGISSWIIAGTSPVSKNISGSQGNPNIKEVMADPYTEGRIYVLCSEGTYRVDNIWSSSPQWNRIRSTTSTGQSTKSMAAWAGSDNKTHLALGENDKIYLSNDAGENWSTVLTENTIKQTRPLTEEPAIRPSADLYCNAVTGIADVIYVALEADDRKGYGVLRGKITAGEVNWEDFSGTGNEVIQYSRSRRAKIRNNNGQNYIYLATSGNGVWRKAVPDTAIVPEIPTKIQTFGLNNSGNYQIFPNPATNFISITSEVKGSINSKVSVVGIDGKKYYQWFISESNQTFDISKLEQGIYIIKIGEFSIKMIKENH